MGKREYKRHHPVTEFVVEQIFKLRAKGHTNAQIAHALDIPSDYVTRIYNGRWPFTPELEALVARLRLSAKTE
jgi:plasmid maintenance system antidote protein VapI